MKSNMRKKTNATDCKGKGRQYKLTQKLLPSILLAIAAPFTVCFFGPFDIYYGNINEFLFSLGDFLPLCLIAAFIFAALICAVLLLLDGIVFDIVSAAIAGISLMFYIQRSYLNEGVASLAGDVGAAAEIGIGTYILNTAIWILVIGGAVCATVFLRKKFSETVNTVLVIAMVALIGMQLVSFTVVSLTSDVYTSVLDRIEKNEGGEDNIQKEPMALTYENMGELSQGKNIVFFLVDRFDADYYEVMEKKDPEFFDKLDGFTHFNDYTALYARTYPAVASILTGRDHDYFTNESKADKLVKIFGDGGGMMGVLKENGYNINLYTERNYAYVDAAVMADYADNTSGVDEYEIDSVFDLGKDMLRLSLSQYLPLVAKNSVGYLSTPTFNAHAIYETEGELYLVDETSTADLKERLVATEFTKISGKGQFTFIHLFGCHAAYSNTSSKIVPSLEESFDLIYYYIDQMKDMGIYEDATIIITGDHSAALSDSKMIGEANSSDDGTRVTAMLFKKSGDSGSALKTSSAQISQDDLWNTIFESEGLLDEKKGESFFEIPEGEDRVRRYFFEMYKNSKNNDLKYNRVYEYEIVGNANDGESWKIVSETDIIK